MKKIHFPFAVWVALVLPVVNVQAQIAVDNTMPRDRDAASLPPEYRPGLLQTHNSDTAAAQIELGPVMAFTEKTYISRVGSGTSTWNGGDTWNYTGEMYMEGGKTYTFAANIDDHATIDIDGTNIFAQPFNSFGIGTYMCEHTGWHSISIRLWDTGGAYGNRNGFSLGIAYNITGQVTQEPISGWIQLIDPGNGSLFRVESDKSALCVSSQIRENDPTIIDITYVVYTDSKTMPTVNVRALAFEDGERSFAKVVRPETFVEGTGTNLGDGIAANVEHTVSWRVSADWAVDLAKVSFEILVSDEGQLPVELVTIPAAGTNAEMTINVKRPIEDNIFNALLWHYADHAADLTVVDGELKQGTTLLAKNDCLANTTAPIAYVYDKMGYGLLTGVELEYARMATRWPLSTTGSGTWWIYGGHSVNGQYVTEWYKKSGNVAYLQYGVLRAAGE